MSFATKIGGALVNPPIASTACRPALAENFPRGEKRFHKAAGEGKIIPVLQTDGGQRENFHARRGFHGLLIHFLG